MADGDWLGITFSRDVTFGVCFRRGCETALLSVSCLILWSFFLRILFVCKSCGTTIIMGVSRWSVMSYLNDEIIRRSMNLCFTTVCLLLFLILSKNDFTFILVGALSLYIEFVFHLLHFRFSFCFRFK